MKNCRTCAFCNWHDQYCAATDQDMSKSFMTKNNNCINYKKRIDEEY